MSLGPRLGTLKQLLWSEVNMELHYSVNKFSGCWFFMKSLLSGLSMARKMSSAKSSRLLFDLMSNTVHINIQVVSGLNRGKLEVTGAERSLRPSKPGKPASIFCPFGKKDEKQLKRVHGHQQRKLL